MTRFTTRDLLAIEEALAFRLAGEIGEEGQPNEDYEAALEKVYQRLARRKAPTTQEGDRR